MATQNILDFIADAPTALGNTVVCFVEGVQEKSVCVTPNEMHHNGLVAVHLTVFEERLKGIANTSAREKVSHETRDDDDEMFWLWVVDM